jgi:hypothetical protein
MDRTRALVGASIAVVLVASLAGCAPERGSLLDPAPSTTPGPAPSPAAAFDPNAGASGNKAFFDLVNQATISLDKNPGGKKLINALVDAGFPKTEMELTPDRTAIDLKSDNIQFSVLLGDECLIGQQGNIGYNSTVQPVLGSGKCLVGVTRKINW